MKNDIFDDLVESVREGGKILRGEIEPSRRFLMNDAKTVLTPETLRALAALLDKAPDPQEQVMDGDDLRAHADAWQARIEAARNALRMIEWEPIFDPDTNALLGQLCLWCHRKPHTADCPRQLALAAGEPQQGPDEA